MRTFLLLASLSLIACQSQIQTGQPGPEPPEACAAGSACTAGDAPCASTQSLACGDVALEAACEDGAWTRPFAGCVDVGACSPVSHWLVTVEPAAYVAPFEVVVTAPAPGVLAVSSSAFGAGSSLLFSAETCTLRLESGTSTSCETFDGEEFCVNWTHVLELGTGPTPTATYQDTCWGECGNGSTYSATAEAL